MIDYNNLSEEDKKSFTAFTKHSTKDLIEIGYEIKEVYRRIRISDPNSPLLPRIMPTLEMIFSILVTRPDFN